MTDKAYLNQILDHAKNYLAYAEDANTPADLRPLRDALIGIGHALVALAQSKEPEQIPYPDDGWKAHALKLEGEIEAGINMRLRAALLTDLLAEYLAITRPLREGLSSPERFCRYCNGYDVSTGFVHEDTCLITRAHNALKGGE